MWTWVKTIAKTKAVPLAMQEAQAAPSTPKFKAYIKMELKAMFIDKEKIFQIKGNLVKPISLMVLP